MSLIISLRKIQPWALTTSKDTELATYVLGDYLRTTQTVQSSCSHLVFITKFNQRTNVNMLDAGHALRKSFNSASCFHFLNMFYDYRT